jgi:FkbM family methyltransferase
MNMAVRRLFLGVPILRGLYQKARKLKNHRHFLKLAHHQFVNIDDYQKALELEDGRIVDIHTIDGMTISIRRNVVDAGILAETYLDNSYIRGLILPDHPIVVDIGGFIGDFALYAAKRLNALKVVVCEPSSQNWTLLKRNVANNCYEDRIDVVNKAVTDGRDLMMNVDVPARGQHRVSGYYPSSVERRVIPGISLARLVKEHELTKIDLLKIDCEGGEYDILSATPKEVFSRIGNIVFEYHEIEGYEVKLEDVKKKLCDEGYTLKTHGSLIFASRG